MPKTNILIRNIKVLTYRLHNLQIHKALLTNRSAGHQINRHIHKRGVASQGFPELRCPMEARDLLPKKSERRQSSYNGELRTRIV